MTPRQQDQALHESLVAQSRASTEKTMQDITPLVGEFNAAVALNQPEPGDADKLRAYAARLRARAFNVIAQADRIDGRVSMAQHHETMAVVQFDLSMQYDADAKAAREVVA